MPNITGSSTEVPYQINFKTKRYAPAIKDWMAANPRVPLATLIRDGVKLELRKFAKKKNLHLLN